MKEYKGSGFTDTQYYTILKKIGQVIVITRKPRIHYEGALYQVIVRGNNRS